MTTEVLKRVEDKLAVHKGLQAKLSALKKQEMELREEIVSMIFKQNEFGKKSVSFGSADEVLKTARFEAEIKRNKSKSLDKDFSEDDYEIMDQSSQECIEYVPKMSVGKLNKLDDDADLWEHVTEKESAPNITYKMVAD